MLIKLQGLEEDLPEMIFRIKKIFDVYNVSDYMQLTGKNASADEKLVYISVRDPLSVDRFSSKSFIEFLVNDMLAFLKTLSKYHKVDIEKEIDHLHQVYIASNNMNYTQMLDMFSKWKIVLLNTYCKKG
jgi:hypothetical protein